MHITDSCPKALAPIIPWGRGFIEEYIRVVGSGDGECWRADGEFGRGGGDGWRGDEEGCGQVETGKGWRVVGRARVREVMGIIVEDIWDRGAGEVMEGVIDGRCDEVIKRIKDKMERGWIGLAR